MSWDTESWARRQRTGSLPLKAVLISLSNWINPRNDWFETSIKRLADELETSERTIQRHLGTLEELGFIERQERFSEAQNGRQGWNAYRLRGYSPPKVSYAEPVEPMREGDNLTPSPVTPLSPSPVTPLSPPISNQEYIPPLPSGDAPRGAAPADSRRAAKATILPVGWEVPPIETLEPAARAVAQGWPSGAYAAMAEKFRAHARSTGWRKSDWTAAWGKWVLDVAPDVARAVKAGVMFAPPAGAGTAAAADPDGRDSCKQALGIRVLVSAAVGPKTAHAWIRPLNFTVEGTQLVVSHHSAFRLEWVRDHFRSHLLRVAGNLEVVFVVEPADG